MTETEKQSKIDGIREFFEEYFDMHTYACDHTDDCIDRLYNAIAMEINIRKKEIEDSQAELTKEVLFVMEFFKNLDLDEINGNGALEYRDKDLCAVYSSSVLEIIKKLSIDNNISYSEKMLTMIYFSDNLYKDIKATIKKFQDVSIRRDYDKM